MQYASSFLFSSLVLLSAAAHAEPPAELPPVVVTANRVPTTLEQTGSAVTVITAEEMERRGITRVYDALKTAPGITVSRNGGVGGVSTVRIRGSNPGQVRVMVDGVLINDPSNVDGSVDFNHLSTANIERIEIVRGPQSTLYGSDAIGGVINIITRKGGAPQHTAFAEAGSFHTLRGGVGSHGRAGAWEYGLTAEHLQTKGFSHSSAGNEKDGADSHTVNGRVGYTVSDVLSLDAGGGYSRIYSGFDPAATVDGPAFLEKQVMQGQIGGTWLAAGGDWQHTLSLQGADTHRSFDEPAGFFRFSTFDGWVLAAEYQSTLQLRERDSWVAGVRSERQRAHTTSTMGGVTATDLSEELDNHALFTQYVLGIGEDTTLTAGGRIDKHDIFGTQATYRLTAAQEVQDWDTRFHASIGTGFKAPTLYQLYSIFGNTQLEPEESLGLDLGADTYWLNDRLRVSVTGFYNRFDNLIDYDFLTNSYINIAEAESYGVESEAALEWDEHWAFSFTHTWMLAEDSRTGRVLPRRPKHSVRLGADYGFSNGARLGADIRYVSRQLDSNFSPAYTKTFTTVDIRGSYPLNAQWEAYGRVDNLLDRDYQEALNFNAAGVSGYAGLRARF